MSIVVSNDITIHEPTLAMIDALRNAHDFYYPVEERDGGQVTRRLDYYPVVQYDPIAKKLTVPYGCLPTVRKGRGDMVYYYQTTWHTDTQDVVMVNSKTYRESQKDVLNAIAQAHHNESYGGVIVSPCAGGKTLLGCTVLGQLSKPSLVIVHTKELLNQWVDRMRELFPEVEIGTIQDGKVKMGYFTVGLVQSVIKHVAALRNAFSAVILDEAHHCPAATFVQTVGQLSATVKIGLTASKERMDGMHPLMYATLGPIIAEIAQDDIYGEGNALTPEVRIIRTGWSSPRNPTTQYTKLMTDLVESDTRNTQIADIIFYALAHRRHALVVSSRVAHLQRLHDKIAQAYPDAVQLITGQMKDKDRKANMQRLVAGFPVTFATLQLVKEGLDAPPVDCLIWATPVKDPITVQQAVGRIQRVAPGKPAPMVIDFLDDMGIFDNQMRHRRRVYRSLKGVIREQ
jgi:superfamily II DNA or RNA helicase